MLILGIIPKPITNAIYFLLLVIDSVVYYFVSVIYQLFIYLSTAKILDDAFFANFANRIYAILGVFMLFYLAYALLNAIVDPEKLTKGDKSVTKLAQNLIISLVLLGFLPSIFTYAYRLQNYVLSSNLIGALIMGSEVVDPSGQTNPNQDMISFGDNLSFLVMNSFINPTNENVDMGDNYTWNEFKTDILTNSDYSSLPALSNAIAYGATINGEEKKITYYPIISTAVAVYLIYTLLSFTLDLGVRLFKLAFCQLIAPIPIIMRAMPSKKGIFDKWLKLTITVYLEVFVRVGIMYMGVYFVGELSRNQTITNFVGDGILGMLALVVVILGVFTFVKQAPKMLSETLGIDSGNMKLGIGEKLKASGAFVGGAMLGAGVTGVVRNALGSVGKIGQNVITNGKGFLSANGFQEKSKFLRKGVVGLGTGLVSGFGSTVAGGMSGMYNSFKAGKDAKNIGDMVKGAKEGSKKSYENRIDRENYVAMNNGLIGTARAKAWDTLATGKEWATGEKLTSGIMSKIKFRDDQKKVYDESYKAIFENPEYLQMDALLKEYRAKQSAGVSTVDGRDINELIAGLENNMNDNRFETIHNKQKSVAYAAYNMAQFVKENHKAAKEANFDLNGIDVNDLYINGDDIYRKSTKQALTEVELKQIFEGVDENNNDILDSAGNKTGIKNKTKNLRIQNDEMKQSLAYKEYMKKEEIKNNKK